LRLMATLYTARWVLPVTAPPIPDGGVLVSDDGRIEAVGPASRLPAGARTVDLGDALLMPGLVNVHAHPELAAFRGALEDLPFHRWIPALLALKANAGLTTEDYDAAARWTCAESVRAGVTTLAATEDSGAALDALRDAGMRGVVFREVFGPAPDQADAAVGQLRERVDVMRQRETPLVRVGISPHAPYSVSNALYQRVAGLAREEGLPLAAHVAESRAETELVRNGAGPLADGLAARGIATPPRAPSTIALLERLGVLEARPLLIHAVQLDDQDVVRIARHGCPVAHCPVANARLGHGTAPVPELLDAGVVVGLGTDSVAANNRLDLLEEARVAQLQQRSRQRSPAVLPAGTLLRMATLDGARALGLDARVGSLEPGKDADLCAVGLDGPHTIPAADPVATLFHAARGADVVLTVVRGRVLYRDGTFATLDVDGLRPRIEDAGRRITEAGRGLAQARPHAADPARTDPTGFGGARRTAAEGGVAP
jgi:cytosine/adenosine deaminase-related metal-dependent hydrolase